MPRLLAGVLIQTRCASTAASFPFPTSARPTPHQIFHLPPGASQQDIKRRYYDLVRMHHPDSPACSAVAAADRNARFQAIMVAYDTLRGKNNASTSAHGPWGSSYVDEIERRRKMRERQRMYRRHEYAQPPRYEWESNADDGWKDKMILTFGVVALVLGVAPGIILLPYRIVQQRHLDTAISYSKIRHEAQEEGEARRTAVRERLKYLQSKKDEEGPN